MVEERIDVRPQLACNKILFWTFTFKYAKL